MNDQLPLFDDDKPLPPAHRPTDPETSAEADRRITRSGLRTTHCRLIMTWMVEHGIFSAEEALTTKEIAIKMGWQHGAVNKRTKECQTHGPWAMPGGYVALRSGPIRKCSDRKTNCTTYYVEAI